MRLYKTKSIYIGLLCLGVYLFAGHSTVRAARVKGEEGVKAASAKAAAARSSPQSPGPSSVASAQTAPPSRSPDRPQPSQVNRQPVQTEVTQESKKVNSSAVTINFSDTDITLFIKYIGELTGKIFVVDEKVRAKVNVFSSKEVSVDDAYRLFESVLEMNGFTTIPSGDFIRIVPAVDARAKNIVTKLREEAVSPDDRVETRLIQLRYADPEELKRTFAPLISKNSVMIDYAPTGMLIITDVKSNITRLLKIIDEIDVEGMGEQISVIPLEYATASEIAQTMNDVYQASIRGAPRAEAARSGSVPKIVPYDRTNDLIVRATETETLGIKAFIELLDKEAVRGEGDIHVRYLQNANAEDLAQTLASIRSGETQAARQGEAPIISKEVQIVPDKATNSLVIMAKKEDYAILEDVIAQLDISRRMVHIEALIMEVDVNKDFELGVEWQAAEPVGSHDGNDLIAFGHQTQGQMLNPFEGFSYGVIGGTISISGVPYTSIGAVITAMEQESNVYIKQTPSIMTTDNEEAEIVVAKNVPFQTRVETSTDLTGREFATYEYKDVGVILKITPQINQERFVRLKISLEVSQVVEEETQKGLPTTLKRQVGTTVIVKDTEKIVIGGLIDEILEEGTTQTPCLGDIPLLGWLFKTASRKGKKTNLYVFLEPHIVENPEEAGEIYREKREDIDKLKDGVIKMYEGRPSDTEDMILSDQGFELLESEDYDTAEGYFESALEINQDNPYALLNLGVVYDVKGERDKAIQMYERVIQLDPDDRAALSTNPEETGNRLADIARDNLKRLQ
ncbi:MAG: type II secretion system secretin GspD [Deltaproteobacteria bacterium]|nr:type II secretion system secretin GspD [Deltaproteobacteria bacterium]